MSVRIARGQGLECDGDRHRKVVGMGLAAELPAVRRARRAALALQAASDSATRLRHGCPVELAGMDQGHQVDRLVARRFGSVRLALSCPLAGGSPSGSRAMRRPAIAASSACSFRRGPCSGRRGAGEEGAQCGVVDVSRAAVEHRRRRAIASWNRGTASPGNPSSTSSRPHARKTQHPDLL